MKRLHINQKGRTTYQERAKELEKQGKNLLREAELLRNQANKPIRYCSNLDMKGGK